MNGPTEAPVVGPILAFRRDTHLFSEQRDLIDRLQSRRRLIQLAQDQILHADTGSDFIVRRGKLRVSQFMPRGREVTRAVLQAGTVLATRSAGGENPAADVYWLADVVLMALGEVELWALPEGSLGLEF